MVRGLLANFRNRLHTSVLIYCAVPSPPFLCRLVSTSLFTRHQIHPLLHTAIIGTRKKSFDVWSAGSIGSILLSQCLKNSTLTFKFPFAICFQRLSAASRPNFETSVTGHPQKPKIYGISVVCCRADVQGDALFRHAFQFPAHFCKLGRT
jgi:hypothetical protein